MSEGLKAFAAADLECSENERGESTSEGYRTIDCEKPIAGRDCVSKDESNVREKGRNNDVINEGSETNHGCTEIRHGEDNEESPFDNSSKRPGISKDERHEKINGGVGSSVDDESNEGTRAEENYNSAAGFSGDSGINSNLGVSGNIDGISNASVSGVSNSGVGSSGGRSRRRNGGRKTGGKRKTRHETPLSKCVDCQTVDGPFFWLGSDAGEKIGPRCNKCHEIKIALLARRNRKVSRARVENYLNELLDAHGLPGAQRAEETEDEAWLRVIGENYDEATTCREIILDIDELDASCQFRHIPDLPDAPFKKRPTPLSYDEISLYSYCLKVCPLVARLM